LKPGLKYRGGKSREISLFEKYIPQDFECYFEPFFGGGALFFYLEPKKAIINDVNQRLMTFYTHLRNNYETMRKQLDELQSIYEENQLKFKILKAKNPDLRVENNNEKLYYEMRADYNYPQNSKYLDGVLYYYINKTAYSGMIRFNSNGEYNVPFGRYANFSTKIITEKHSELLNKADLFCMDYKNIFDKATSSDFMFLDPPYNCIFNDYGNLDKIHGFDEEQHRRLATDFKNLSCKAMMVIGKTPLTEELYGDYIIDEYNKSYAVNIRNRFKADAKHIIVINYKK